MKYILFLVLALLPYMAMGQGSLGTMATQNANNVTITGGTINNTTIGATTAVTGKFSTVNGLTISTTNGTLTIPNGGSLITSGGHSLTLTTTGSTNVTLPTSGTLLTANQTITLSGDVSGSGSTSITTAIGNNKVTGAMIALGSDASGDIMYYNGTDYVRLAAGGANTYLKAGTPPTWGSSSAGGLATDASKLTRFSTSGELQAIWVQAYDVMAGDDLGQLKTDRVKFLYTTGTPYYIELVRATPTADRTISIPDASGTLALLQAPIFPTTITIGESGGTTGSVLFKGTTSGTVTVKSKDAAGTWTMTLPDTDGASGEILSTDGIGGTSWVAASGSGDMLKATYDSQNLGYISGLDYLTSPGGDLNMDAGSGGGVGSRRGGHIYTIGGSAGNTSGGHINTSGGSSTDAAGGEVNTSGGAAAGGDINTSGSGSGSFAGGYIHTYGDTAAGGTIDTSDGGGNVQTNGTGFLGLGVGGVNITTDSDGAITFTGNGNGNDEDLKINLDDGAGGANTVEVTSSTGVTRIDFTSIGLKAAGGDVSGGTFTMGTVAGAIDAGGATSLEVPNGNDPDVSVQGQIGYDNNGNIVRGYDGTNQVALGRKIEALHCTVILPNDLADSERDAFWMWSNESGMSFVVTGWKAWSDTDDTTLNIEEIDSDGQNNATVDAVEIATNGTGLFYASDNTITAATIENGHLLVLDFDDTDVPGQVKIVIYGYYNADVN